MNEDPLYTKWGEKIYNMGILEDYPRPQMKRGSWLCLNGPWDYAIDREPHPPEKWQGKILVPFSPEAPLSGVNRQLQPDEFLHYKVRFSVPAEYLQGRLLLHFDAVDQRCTVRIGGEVVGTHTGGYLPFAFDITGRAKAEDNILTVDVRDESEDSEHARGKQMLDRGGIWYTAQSGIWGTVWLEPVPREYVHSFRVTPLFDESAVSFSFDTGGVKLPCSVAVSDGKKKYEGAFSSDETGRIALPDFRAWSPEDPFLYSVSIKAGKDEFTSYFGMRKFSVERADDGYMRLFLNGKPYFHTGVLDQGYWSDGLYTAPSDDAMVADISEMKRLGFNTLRKHMKIEPLRWYYHCDRLGMLVWQDMPCGGGKYRFSVTAALPNIGLRRLGDGNYRLFGRESQKGRAEFIHNMEGTVSLLYNCVSVALWTVFNEGWGQFDSAAMALRLQKLDGTRTIDPASGWHDQGGGEVLSLHTYFHKVRVPRDSRAVLLSEFGGYALHVEGHCVNDEDYGYKKCRSFESLCADVAKLYRREIIPSVEKGLAAAIYTQLSDVEDEQNGLLTYDRRICKLPPHLMRELNAKLTK